MKALFHGNLMEVEPRIDFENDNDGVAVVRDKDGKEIGIVSVYGWNLEEPYVLTPLYFIELPEVSAEQRFALIKQFEEWYGDTDQDVSYWALEFELLTRMLCYDTAALIINPKFLELDDNMYQIIGNIVYPKLFDTIEDALEKDFIRVYDENGQRMLQFFGYVYDSESPGINKDGKEEESLRYRIVEYSGMEMPLDEYLSMETYLAQCCDKKGSVEEFFAESSAYDHYAEMAKQYITDADEVTALECSNRWFGWNVRVTRIPGITAELPCGYFYF